MSRFIYDEEDVKGLKIIQLMDKIIERNNNSVYTHHDLVEAILEIVKKKKI